MLSGEATIAETLTREEGKFDLSVAPGEYTLKIIVDQFETYVEIIRVTSEQQSLAITLNVAQVISVLDVQDQMNMISLDPDNNLTATILDEDFLADLPDDEEELAQALRDLAGPTAGGEEASFIIDGFSGGRLPPKDQIRQVRINNNPFTSEHSRHGRGRIEILTRAGTGAYHGSLNFDFRPSRSTRATPSTPSNRPTSDATGEPTSRDRSFPETVGELFGECEHERQQQYDSCCDGRWPVLRFRRQPVSESELQREGPVRTGGKPYA